MPTWRRLPCDVTAGDVDIEQVSEHAEDRHERGLPLESEGAIES